ncbi:hypothetical protein F4604DRAFT_1675361 [Suillus subluteus]|nr:hypothetical protein F4604DRAFT_1675361 [Suillus subluteus]
MFKFSNIDWPLSSAVSASGNGDSAIADDLDQQYNASTFPLVPSSSDLDAYPDLAWRDSTDLWGNLLNTDKKKLNHKIPTTAWSQRMRLTKALFLDSLFLISHVLLLFFESLTYSLMLQTFDNGKAELHKVVKTSLTHLTNFCNESLDHRKETIIVFVKCFNEDIQELQNVLAKLTGKQLYQTMLILLVEFDGKTAIASFKTHVNMNGDIMSTKDKPYRVLHLPQERLSRLPWNLEFWDKWLASFPRSQSSSYRREPRMKAVNMMVKRKQKKHSHKMSARKTPRHVVVGKEKRAKVLDDVKDINTNPSTQTHQHALPNNGGFRCYSVCVCLHVCTPPQVQDASLSCQLPETLLGVKGSMLRQKNSPPPEYAPATISRYQTQTLKYSARTDYSVSHKVNLTSHAIASVLANLTAIDMTVQVEAEANVSAPVNLLVKIAPPSYICVRPPGLVCPCALFRSTEAIKNFMTGLMALVGDPVLLEWVVLVLAFNVTLNGYLLKDIAEGAMRGLQPNNVCFRSVIDEKCKKDDEDIVTPGIRDIDGCRWSSFMVGDSKLPSPSSSEDSKKPIVH